MHPTFISISFLCWSIRFTETWIQYYSIYGPGTDFMEILKLNIIPTKNVYLHPVNGDASLSPPAAPPVPLPPWKQMKSHLTRIFHISPIPLTWILYTVHLLHGFWSLMIKSTKWIYCFGSVLANMKLKKMKNNIFGMGESVLLKPDLCNETKCKDWNFKRNPSMKIKGHER